MPEVKRLAPGPRRRPIIGNLAEFGRGDMISFHLENWRRHGDVVRYEFGPKVAHLVVDPADVKRVLLDNEKNYVKGNGYNKVKLIVGNGLFTSEGPRWRRQRKLMQPPFTPRGVEQFAPAMIEAIDRMLSRWDAKARAESPINVANEMMRLAMSVIARTMLSIDVDERAVAAATAFTTVLEFASRHSMSILDLPLYVPTPENLAFRRAMSVIDSFVLGVIAERRRDPNPPDDLLTKLMTARDSETGEAMTLRQIHDEVLTIFFAGHETTAQALTWAWYILDSHPEVVARLQRDVDATLGGRAPTVADLPGLDYARMIVSETMRLYPPVWIFVRDAVGPDQLGGYDVPAGSMIMLSQYLTHRHPEFWPDPERFDPERFAPGAEETRPRYAYFPFGGGPRVCLGNNFALLEATLAVAMVAQRYSLHLVPGQTITPKMVGTLRPSGPVMMRLEAREPALVAEA